MRLRHQLAVYSPISFRALAAAATAPFSRGVDPLDRLASLLRREFDATEALLCGSGTQALQLAIQAARKAVSGSAGSDAIVALPAFSCFDVASAAIGAGGPVVLYDLHPTSLSPDLASLERVLRTGAKVVVVAPLYGIPVDWTEIQDLASAHGALLIEDAAQGQGASYRGKSLGALGAISTLSFGRGKGWTGGSGGAVLVRGLEGLAWPALDAAPPVDFGTVVRLDAQFLLGRPALYWLPRSLPGLDLGETVYHPPRRPTALSRAAAAAALATRDGSVAEAGRRRAAGEWLHGQIAENRALRAIAISGDGDSSPGFLRFPALAQRGFAGFASETTALRAGIAPSYPRALGDLPELAPQLLREESHFPGASRLVEELITLPAHSLLSARDRATLTQLLRDYRAG